MNKKELVSAVADATGFNKAQIERTLEASQDAVVQALAKGEDVRIQGFGTYSTVTRAGRKGTTPSGEPFQTSASRKPRFAASSTVLELLNKR